MLEFKMFVSVGLRSLYRHDAGLVGTYKMDLGMVCKEHPHLFKSKWLILSDSKHHFGEVKV